ncbi:hypothetical protein [Enterococcus wangshanyuanii]|uniref:Uncharacterized protein n=1 Tax=Enterococcus wangshanyuanii TaxID=2005703 RepID=A0ABQ1PTR9_9ENTE|nr:hypothetical protein [Enterococcus wangshanyuanii]GGD03564.1 hypothetical protein GCM10011573_36280 [Enterococcus wangshanyuanii]
MKSEKYFVYDPQNDETTPFDSYEEAKSYFDDLCDRYANWPEDDSEVYLMQPIQKGFWKDEYGEKFVVRKYDN